MRPPFALVIATSLRMKSTLISEVKVNFFQDAFSLDHPTPTKVSLPSTGMAHLRGPHDLCSPLGAHDPLSLFLRQGPMGQGWGRWRREVMDGKSCGLRPVFQPE